MNRHHAQWVALSIIVLAFGLRVLAIDEKAVWWDEAWTVWVAGHDLAGVTEITAHDTHPPLYKWLLFAWMRAAGQSEFALRTLSAFLGTLTVATVYGLTRRLTKTPLAALLAMLFLSFSVLHVRWSQEIRMYALAAWLVTLAFYAYCRLSSGGDIRRRDAAPWVLLITAGVGAALTHYLAGFALVILNLHWLIFWRTHTRAFHRRWIAAMIAVALLWGMWFLYAASTIRRGAQVGSDAVSLPGIFELYATLAAVGQSVDLADYRAVTLFFTGVFAVGLGIFTRLHPRRGVLIVLTALVPPLAVFLLSLPVNPFFSPKLESRYFVMFVPVIYAGLGAAVFQLWRAYWAFGMGVVLALVGVFGAAYLDERDTRYFQDDYAMMMGAVDLLAQPDEPVFFISGERFPLVFYNLDKMTGGQPQINPIEIPASGDDIDAIMERVIGETPRFWLIEIEASLGDAEGLRRAWIHQHYRRIDWIPVAHNSIGLYTRDNGESALPNPETLLPPVVREARPGDAVRVGVPAGQTVTLEHAGQVVYTHTPERWELVTVMIYPAYPPGTYVLRADGNSYPFRVTHAQKPPDAPSQNSDAVFGDLRLLGYAISKTRIRPGDTLDITLYWRAESPPVEDYTVFFQVIGDTFNPETGSPVWAQQDEYPAGTPTTQWWTGLTAYDRRRVTLPQNAPPGTYQLIIGLYRLETGERLLTADGADHFIIGTIPVESSS